jgi:hypothetical protein
MVHLLVLYPGGRVKKGLAMNIAYKPKALEVDETIMITETEHRTEHELPTFAMATLSLGASERPAAMLYLIRTLVSSLSRLRSASPSTRATLSSSSLDNKAS